jgi:class 3 adenylate cyclase/tetratricopeptide (TPR) repeat protein
MKCGSGLARACEKCSTELPAGAAFCVACGHAVPGQAATILASKASLEGERKHVTVLFADVKDSMELLAERDPEDARTLLDPILEIMMEAVHRYDGTVNQVMGDGIMALFGAPLADEDHAIRACYAALRMQERVKQYATEAHRAEGVLIQIRAGLNAGEVVVRSIGSDLRMDYSAIGQTTHVAARLEQLAKPGTVLISPETARLAEGYLVVKPLGPRSIKGLDAPLDVYELVGAAPVRSRFQAVAARGLTRFVGRDAELEQLRYALDRAGAGHGQVVAVVGEPGVGKSRLCWEFSQLRRAQGWRVIQSGSVSYGKATSYLSVLELLRAYFEIEPRDDSETIREKVTGRLLALERELVSSLPALLWILDVPVEDPTWERLDPRQRRQQVLDGVKRLLLRESQAQPLMVVVEDLHWIDTETQALLDSLVESLPTARLLLLVNYRPEYRHAWSGKTSYRQLRIDPLPATSADELLDALLGSDADLHALKRRLIERTEGNPFFLEESVRMLVETGFLVGERGAYRQAKTYAGLDRTLPIPESVHALLAARIDRLAPEHKRVLQAASVVGTDVPFVLLHAIADEPEGELRASMAQLVAAEFLYETRLFPELEFTFKHALTHEVTYGGLLHERRRPLHARVVEAIEGAYPDRLDEQVERLAHHAARGELWPKAFGYLRQAGVKAYMRSSSREAVALFEQALMALTHLDETRETIEQAIDVRFDIRNALQPLGDLGRIIGYLKEADGLAVRLDDERRLGWVASYLTEHYRMLGEPDLAAEAGRRALDIGERLGDLAMQVVTRLPLGLLYRALGDYRRAMDFLGWNTAHLTGDLVHERFGLFGLASVFSRAFSVLCLAELGQFPEGLVIGEESIRLAEAADQPFSRVYAYLGVGALHLRQGDFPRAIPTLEQSVAVARSTHIPVGFVYAGSLLGYGLTLVGRVGDGLPLLEEAVDQSATMKLVAGHSVAVAYLGEAYLLSGRVADAAAAAELALELALHHGERGNEAYARRLAAEVAAARDDLPAAAARYQESLALADELGMRPFLAHCHRGLARVLRRLGQEPAAGSHRETAGSLFRDMAMHYWTDRLAADK